MYKAVYKYALQTVGRFTIDVPMDARFLHVAVQHGRIQLWALVDPSAPIEKRAIAVVHTGSVVLPPGAGYLGTVITDGGDYVRHVFDLGTTNDA